LPRALELERFETIRDRLDRLEVRLCTVETLTEEGVKADAFNLSDIFEYMSPQAHEDAYASILAAARPGARIAYWNMMAPRRVPAPLADRVTTDAALEAKLKPLDKAFFYSDFVIETVT
jgi:S-adenosylmethionine-diacylglycerol 3-amino-3-carboxypropyl transferase